MESAGEMFTNIRVFALPPSESDMSCVSGWLRYGTPVLDWAAWPFLARASMTSSRAESDWLIATASLNAVPVTSERCTLSLPAMSTKLSLPRCVSPAGDVLEMPIENTRCERLLCAFMAVPETCRRDCPSSSSFNVSLALVTTRSVMFWM